MGFIKDFIQKYFFDTARDRRRSEVNSKTYELAEQGRYAEAAEMYARQALEELKDNELIYCLDCRDAFGLWLKAREPDSALREARNILRVYIENDGKWLKYDSGGNVEDLTSMVSDFFAAGYTAEAAAFAGEVNYQLEKYNLPMRCAAVPVSKNIFPSLCSNCGAKLSSSPYHDAIECSYCRVVIYAANLAADADDKKSL